MEPTFTVAGIVVYHPTNVLTDLALAVQSALLARATLRSDRIEALTWAAFFVLTSVSTSFGAFKHALGPDALALVRVPVLVSSGMAAAVATLMAQLATLQIHAPPARRRRVLGTLARVQLALFALAFVYFDAFALVGVDTAVGLAPVLVAETKAAAGGRPGAGAIAAGLGVSLLAGAVYAAGLSPGPWFDHVDVAHALVFVALSWIRRGVAERPGPTLRPAEEVAAWT
jgi:hypothetical protein